VVVKKEGLVATTDIIALIALTALFAIFAATVAETISRRHATVRASTKTNASTQETSRLIPRRGAFSRSRVSKFGIKL
jgi:high-affinity K+ transport system ATPase subunit B